MSGQEMGNEAEAAVEAVVDEVPIDLKEDKSCGFFEATCAMAMARQQGLILAVERGYDATPGSASGVFLKVDYESAHHPAATFRNAELDELLDHAMLPTVGGLEEGDHVMRGGFARERVLAYAQCKASLMKAHAMSTDATDQAYLASVKAAVGVKLRDAEAALMDGGSVVTSPITEILACEIESGTPAPDEVRADRMTKLGTERFVSIVFPPHDHAELAAAGAVNGGVRVTATRCVHPAYVTVHNAKGCIESLPATDVERRPNSFIVSDAALMLHDLHALSAASGREHTLITHVIPA